MKETRKFTKEEVVRGRRKGNHGHGENPGGGLMKPTIASLEKFNPCPEGLTYLREQECIETAWRNCKNAGWMIWGLTKLNLLSEPVAREFMCDCAEHSLHFFEDEYPEDKRPRRAIEAGRALISVSHAWSAESAAESAALAARSAALAAAHKAARKAALAAESAAAAAVAVAAARASHSASERLAARLASARLAAAAAASAASARLAEWSAAWSAAAAAARLEEEAWQCDRLRQIIDPFSTKKETK